MFTNTTLENPRHLMAHIAALCDGDLPRGKAPSAVLWKQLRGMYTIAEVTAMRGQIDRQAEARCLQELRDALVPTDAGVAEQIANAWSAAQ